MGLCSALICVKRAHLAALGVCEANAIHIDVLSASARPITVFWLTAAMFFQPKMLRSAVGLLNLRPPSALRLDLFLKFVRYDFQNL